MADGLRVTVDAAKGRLDEIISKGKVDLYKPIQVAEVLRRFREDLSLNAHDLDQYKNPSLSWRNEVTHLLTRKRSTSSAQYQHNLWADNAMRKDVLALLDAENKKTDGAVERYVYLKYAERQQAVTKAATVLREATSDTFSVDRFLQLFDGKSGIQRSIDKTFEVLTYSLFETIVQSLGAEVTLRVPDGSDEMLGEFAELGQILLGVSRDAKAWRQPARLYRAGVTNAADQGLDMWANFGPAVQVKHISLNVKNVGEIIRQIESDNVIVVCKVADPDVVSELTSSTGWGGRVRGIVTESELGAWYSLALRGEMSERLAEPLLNRLRKGFRDEFPQTETLDPFLSARGYLDMIVPERWKTAIDKTPRSELCPADS